MITYDTKERNPSKEVRYEGRRYLRASITGRSITSFIQKNTPITYRSIRSKFPAQFGERDLNSFMPDEILSFP